MRYPASAQGWTNYLKPLGHRCVCHRTSLADRIFTTAASSLLWRYEMQSCIFCKIVAGEIPCKKVYEDDALFAFEDVNPAAPTHILIIPKRHMETLHEIQDTDKELIGSIFVAANEIARKQGIAQEGFRIVVNCGENGGQTVFHIHFHLLGGRRMEWPPG